MKCQKTVFRLSLLSLFSFLFSVFLSSVSSPAAFATSVKCFENNTLYNSYTGSYLYFSSSNPNSVPQVCDISSLDSSKNWYYYLKVTTGDDSDSSKFGTLFFFAQAATAQSISNYQRATSFVMSASDSAPSQNVSFEGVVTDFYLRTGSHFGILGGSASYPFYYNHVDSVVVADNLSDLFSCPVCEECQECQECEECPECPEGGGACNYDQKFDGVITAIYTVGAVALVIYFFYCIYRMIIGTTGGTK